MYKEHSHQSYHPHANSIKNKQLIRDQNLITRNLVHFSSTFLNSGYPMIIDSVGANIFEQLGFLTRVGSIYE